MRERTYLDWNAGAPLLPEAARAVSEVVAGPGGNPSSVHAEGRHAREVVERARAEVAALVGAAPDEVIFTSGGAEANAAGIRGLLPGSGGVAGRVVAMPGVEHPSALAAGEQLNQGGALVRRPAVDRDGVLRLDSLAEIFATEAVTLVCVQLANSETGVVQPIAEIVEMSHARGARMHCDAVQAAGKMDVAAEVMGADTVALSAHKLGGLPGTGALVVRRGAAFVPLIPGTQERHRRGGTENLAGIAAFGVAARLASERASQWRVVARLRDAFEDELLSRLPQSTIHGRQVARLPNTSCLGLPPPCLGGVMAAALDLCGFAVSSGSACSSGVERGSTVVEAMGYDADSARRTLRVSLGPLTAESDVRAFLDALVGVVERTKGGRR